MSEETLKAKPLGAESIANALGFSQAEVDRMDEDELGGELDQKFAEGAMDLMGTYSLKELNSFLKTIVEGGKHDDSPPQFTSESGKVLTVEMATVLQAMVQRELEYER